MKILLVSNSTVYGCGYLDHVEQEIRSFLRGAERVLFFPFALYDRNAYAVQAKTRFAAMGYSIQSVHEAENPQKAVEETDAIFIGGGNTFRLLKTLQDLDLVEPICRKVKSGTPYIGSSAGSNVAGPTIKTTNDMPIVQPRSFDALGLVRFQISPHYLDPDPNSRHMGETQEERILQFLEENDTPVVGLREGTWLLVEGNSVPLKGLSSARILTRTGGLGYLKASTLLFAMVLGVLAIWYFVMDSVNVNRIINRKAESFYWLTILTSNTLGTALGDCLADTSGLGYEGGVLVFGGALVLIAALYFYTNISHVVLFWAAFILTRPLGATLGDILTKTRDHGGLNLSRFTSSYVIAAFMIACILLTSRKSEQDTAPE